MAGLITENVEHMEEYDCDVTDIDISLEIVIWMDIYMLDIKDRRKNKKRRSLKEDDEMCCFQASAMYISGPISLKILVWPPLTQIPELWWQ